VETKIASLQDAQSLLGGQLKQVRGQLEASRRALTDYQMEHGIIGLPKNNSTITRESLQQLNKLLIQTQGQRIIAEAAYRNAAAQSPDELANTLDDNGLQTLRTELLGNSARYQAHLQEYGPNHPDMISLRARMEALRKRLKTAALQVRDQLEASFKASQAKESDLRSNLETLARASSQEDRQLVQLSILQRDVESNQELYNTLLQQVKEADLNSGAFRWTNVRSVDRATVPGAPSFPQTQRNLQMGLFLGFAIGVLGCVLLEWLDNRINTPDEVTAALDLPTFAVVPNFRSLTAASAYGSGEHPVEKLNDNGRANGNGNGHAIIPVLHPTSLFSEAYRTLRTNLMFSSPDHPPQTVLVASTEAGEGKTLTTVNLAVSLALSGSRVVLVDADMRRPRCHTAFNVPRHPGLTDVLTGQCDLSKALAPSPLFGDGGYRLPNDQELYLLPAGTTAPNPAELLGSAAMDRILNQLKEQFEFVLLDSPPISRVTDGVVLGTKTDGVLFVIKGGAWSHDIIQRAVAQLDNVHAHTLGVVLNCVDPKRGGSSYYYYRHYHKSYYHSSGYGDSYGATHEADDGTQT
jgi:capsular exopolysaccharide synthesis family protein